MGLSAGDVRFFRAKAVPFEAPPAVLPSRVLRLTLKRRPTMTPGLRVEPGALLNEPVEHDPVGVACPISGRVDALVPWRLGEDRRFDLTIKPMEADARSSRVCVPPSGRDLDEWIVALGQTGPWPNYGLGGDLLDQLVLAREARPRMVICLGLDGLASYPDRSSLLFGMPESAAEGLGALKQICGAKVGKLVMDARLPVYRQLRQACRKRGVRAVGVENVYPSADPVMVVAEHGPRAAAGLRRRWLEHGQNPMRRGVLVVSPWVAIRLGRWIERGEVDLARPAMVGWASPSEPMGTQWVFPGQRLATLAPALTGRANDLHGRAVVGHPMTGRPIVAATGPEGPLPPTVPESDQLVCMVTQPVPTKAEPCISCGWCASACPTKLRPVQLARQVDRGIQPDALRWCIDCGLCSHVCPTHLPLTQLLRAGRE
ncbi:4Fe-4S dicluster domain-containing protein [Phycisphaerales bacterium AB-hyl4]|uniref:4Fe-4S dicluster domain-containing protein n=1 Tax=Natronomicrosphaera hydrolytica TaxID=3242702 RepID=A0ABV4U9U5_9BACT